MWGEVPRTMQRVYRGEELFGTSGLRDELSSFISRGPVVGDELSGDKLSGDELSGDELSGGQLT